MPKFQSKDLATAIADGVLVEARQVPSPNFNQRPDVGDISLLVIHNISLPPDEYGAGFVEDFFCNKLDANKHPYFAEICHLQVSAHVFIDRDGRLLQFVNFKDRAWHAGQSCFCDRDNCNDFSIGIELEGSDHQAYTEEQYQALVICTLAIQNSYPAINMDRIVGHSDIAPGRKSDPGDAFDWIQYRSRLLSELKARQT
jgi:AmpD protein